MPHHRLTSDSIPVADLLGDLTVDRVARHRMADSSAGRAKGVAGVAVAAGAVLATMAQAAPAMAASTDQGAEAISDSVELPDAMAPVSTPVAAPFGLAGLPAELAGPLAQAEQLIQDFQKASTPVAPPAAAPAVLPVGGEISSGFGSRWGAFHYGVDIADTLGTPIRSAMGGTVLEAGPASGFGQWVRVQQDDGTIAVYGHINDYYVQAGDRVDAGDVIASVGNRGQSTGPHLHLEIWDEDSNKIDPVAWLAGNGVLTEQRWGSD
ncbi:M23 family metallopeptidase [Nocardia fluminea]|uniref:M23 family metallopeptidase n=1 Tax=Nocardia fluminea TaxID=134984 RepID=UPI0033EE4DF2